MRTFTIDDVREIKVAGPWKTKSDAFLNVFLKIPWEDLQDRFFNYDESEIDLLPKGFDIRGLRLYDVAPIKKGFKGGGEWHRIREETVICPRGKARWVCVDRTGNKKEYILEGGNGVWMPPTILHTYESLADDTELLVICNTLFDPDDPQTQDTFSEEAFAEIKM